MDGGVGEGGAEGTGGPWRKSWRRHHRVRISVASCQTLNPSNKTNSSERGGLVKREGVRRGLEEVGERKDEEGEMVEGPGFRLLKGSME